MPYHPDINPKGTGNFSQNLVKVVYSPFKTNERFPGDARSRRTFLQCNRIN